MSKNKKDENLDGNEDFRINTLSDLIRLNLKTIEDVVTGNVDTRRAGLIFTGSRTVTSTIRLGIEAMKLGVKSVGGVDIGDTKRIVSVETIKE